MRAESWGCGLWTTAVSTSSGTTGRRGFLFSSTEVSEASRGAGARDFHQRAEQQIGGDFAAVGGARAHVCQRAEIAGYGLAGGGPARGIVQARADQRLFCPQGPFGRRRHPP